MAASFVFECGHRRAVSAPLRWAALIASVAATFYLSLPVSAYWLWVADSAFRGIREAADPSLVVVAVAMALLPLVGGVGSWFWCNRTRSWSRVTRSAVSFCAVVATSVVTAFAAAFVQLPF
ncbi:hypothetical protein [Dermatobacter hominis]|uniref:hypothetical protein n=1 Tax=Dermatobacter hominis TaxID=2884263 RepID=UPI001D10FA17|nr:hypothetical protein [Dermatobacter hominis]UDY36085.1 hypothetical protein LH044_00785 [Dermatobacter hominis]